LAPVAAVDRDTFDITDPAQVTKLFAQSRPTLAINCAAYTNVDKCETETDAANAVNGYAVAHLARAAREHGTKLVHYSTDFVFDGSSQRPYRAEDPTNPLSAYGRSKLLGEQQLRENATDDWLILRTAWLYGPGGASFPKTMLDLARAGKPLRVVSDQTGSPTFTLRLIDHNARGIFHLTNSGQTTWFDFARAIFDEFGLAPDLQPITAAEWKRMKPNSAVRPAYSVLDVEPHAKLTGTPMRHWREALHEFRSATSGAS
jgi:dTDP-4-dehydrorhamnose reductase